MYRPQISKRHAAILILLTIGAVMTTLHGAVAEPVPGEPPQAADPLKILHGKMKPVQLFFGPSQDQKAFALPVPDLLLGLVPTYCLAGSESPTCARARELAMAGPCTRADDCRAYDLWRGWIGDPKMELADEGLPRVKRFEIPKDSAFCLWKSANEEAAVNGEPAMQTETIDAILDARQIDCAP